MVSVLAILIIDTTSEVPQQDDDHVTLFQYRLAGGQSGKFQCAVRCGTDMVTDKVTVTVPSPGQYCHIISMLHVQCAL